MHWCGEESGTFLQIVGTAPSNQEQHEKPENDERCPKQKPEGASLELGECEQNEYTPQDSKQRTHLDGGICIGGPQKPRCAEGEGCDRKGSEK